MDPTTKVPPNRLQRKAKKLNIVDTYRVHLFFALTQQRTCCLYGFENEDQRLSTFYRSNGNESKYVFPHTSTTSNVNAELLAAGGFIYNGTDDHVLCVFCGLNIGYWRPLDVILEEHCKHDTQKRCPMTNPTKENVNVARPTCSQLKALRMTKELEHINEYLKNTYNSPKTSKTPIMNTGASVCEQSNKYFDKEYMKALGEAGFVNASIGSILLQHTFYCPTCGLGMTSIDQSIPPENYHCALSPTCPFVTRNYIFYRLFQGRTELISVELCKIILDSNHTPEGRSKSALLNIFGPEVLIGTLAAQLIECGRVHASYEHFMEHCFDIQSGDRKKHHLPATVMVVDKISISCIKREQKEPNNFTCEMCNMNPIAVLFQPCKHAVVCELCKYNCSVCPACNTPVKSICSVVLSPTVLYITPANTSPAVARVKRTSDCIAAPNTLLAKRLSPNDPSPPRCRSLPSSPQQPRKSLLLQKPPSWQSAHTNVTLTNNATVSDPDSTLLKNDFSDIEIKDEPIE